MKPIFDMQRVDETTAFIAAELRTLLDRNTTHSHISRRIDEACPAYKKGLTNGEGVLATLLALNLIQNEVARDLASLRYEITGPRPPWEEDEDAAA